MQHTQAFLGDTVEMHTLSDDVGHEREQPPIGSQTDLRLAWTLRAQTTHDFLAEFYRHTIIANFSVAPPAPFRWKHRFR